LAAANAIELSDHASKIHRASRPIPPFVTSNVIRAPRPSERRRSASFRKADY